MDQVVRLERSPRVKTGSYKPPEKQEKCIVSQSKGEAIEGSKGAVKKDLDRVFRSRDSIQRAVESLGLCAAADGHEQICSLKRCPVPPAPARNVFRSGCR